jgi:hypothetical protein
MVRSSECVECYEEVRSVVLTTHAAVIHDSPPNKNFIHTGSEVGAIHSEYYSRTNLPTNHIPPDFVPIIWCFQ